MIGSIENLWEVMLSRNPARIIAVFQALSEEDQTLVFQHLKLMATDKGWHPEQRFSADSALNVINDFRNKSNLFS